MKLRYQVPLWLLVVGLVRGLTTGGFDLEGASGTQAAQANMGPPAPAAPGAATTLCPAGCPHYPGDAAPREDRARWMGSAALQRGIPPELPVMAALVESGPEMLNLDHGDADSVGLFQMRLKYHNKGEYAGYPDNPNLQIEWFLDTAESVKADRLADGLSLGPESYGRWIVGIERCDEQYEYRYQPMLDTARALLQPK